MFRSALVVLVTFLGACSADNPLAGKSWKRLAVLQEQQFLGPAFDAQERLVVHGFFSDHTYRLDPTTDLWDDLGQSLPGTDAGLFGDAGANIYMLLQPATTPTTFDLYRLDDRTFTKLVTVDDGHIVFGAANTMWLYKRDVGAMTTTVQTRTTTSSDWVTTGVFDGILAGSSTTHGDQILRSDNGSAGLLSKNGDALQPLFTCGSVMELYCNPMSFFRDASGVTFLSRNGLDGADLFRVAPGSTTPTLITKMPEIDVAAPVAFGLEHDADGNGYLLYGSNGGDTVKLYYLAAGDSSWQYVINWPESGRLLAVSPGGKVYAVAEGTGATYVLE